MLKKKFLSFLPLILLLSAFTHPALAEESITITTYYPSPYGVYNALQTDKLGVGDNNSDGSLTSLDVPTNPGEVWIKGNVGIGTTSPGAKLEVAGQVKITGGTPRAGKVLTSDTSGLASWQTASGGVTTQNDVSGSREFDKVYRNTLSKPMFVSVSSFGGAFGGHYYLMAYSNAANPPDTRVAAGLTYDGSMGGLFFIVLPNNYYKLTAVSPTPYKNPPHAVSWIEWN